MNRIAIRRRWLLLRPWINDIATGVLVIAFMIAAFRLMDIAAAAIQAWEYGL